MTMVARCDPAAPVTVPCGASRATRNHQFVSAMATAPAMRTSHCDAVIHTPRGYNASGGIQGLSILMVQTTPRWRNNENGRKGHNRWNDHAHGFDVLCRFLIFLE